MSEKEQIAYSAHFSFRDQQKNIIICVWVDKGVHEKRKKIKKYATSLPEINNETHTNKHTHHTLFSAMLMKADVIRVYLMWHWRGR